MIINIACHYYITYIYDHTRENIHIHLHLRSYEVPHAWHTSKSHFTFERKYARLLAFCYAAIDTYRSLWMLVDLPCSRPRECKSGHGRRHGCYPITPAVIVISNTITNKSFNCNGARLLCTLNIQHWCCRSRDGQARSSYQKILR